MHPSYLRTALTPRMVVLLVVLIGIAGVCARLGAWQLDRATQRAEQEAATRSQQEEQVPPVPLADVLAPQESFPGSLVGRKVVVSGTYDDQTLLVPGRAVDGRTGYLVLDRFRVAAEGADGAGGAGGAEGVDGAPAADGATLPVVRGWVADAADPPAPPQGHVRLVGFLQAGEAAGESGLPPGQVGAVSSGQLVNLWGSPIYSGYLVVADAGEGLTALPPPTLPGEGLDIQNLAYALQWWIFGAFAVLVWARMVRDEARAAAEERSVPASA